MRNGIIKANPNPKFQTSKIDRGIPSRMRHGRTVDVRVNMPPMMLNNCLTAAKLSSPKSMTVRGFKNKKKKPGFYVA